MPRSRRGNRIWSGRVAALFRHAVIQAADARACRAGAEFTQARFCAMTCPWSAGVLAGIDVWEHAYYRDVESREAHFASSEILPDTFGGKFPCEHPEGDVRHSRRG